MYILNLLITYYLRFLYFAVRVTNEYFKHIVEGFTVGFFSNVSRETGPVRQLDYCEDISPLRLDNDKLGLSVYTAHCLVLALGVVFI